MSQQEFEPQQHQPDEELYQVHYPWSGQQEGLPRDEPPGGNYAYNTQESQAGQQNAYNAYSETQVPWWARPQPQRSSPAAFVGIVLIAIVILFVVGGMGLLGLVLGSLAHILGVILGAIFAFFIFFLCLIFLIVALIRRALRRAFGLPDRSDRRGWRYERRAARRATQRAWRDW